MIQEALEKALTAEGQRMLVDRLDRIEKHLRPKTSAEILDDILRTSTPEQRKRIAEARIAEASLEEVAYTLAEINHTDIETITGFKTLKLTPSIAKPRETLALSGA